MSAMKLIPMLNQDSQYSPRLMCEVYDAILKEAKRREGDIISNKLRLGFASKISFALASLELDSINPNGHDFLYQ